MAKGQETLSSQDKIPTGTNIEKNDTLLGQVDRTLSVIKTLSAKSTFSIVDGNDNDCVPDLKTDPRTSHPRPKTWQGERVQDRNEKF